MLQFNPYASLESGKEMLVSKIQLQNSLGEQAIDTSSTWISIFGSGIRDTIQHGAELCNINSSQLATLDPQKGKNSVNELCSSGSQRISDLHELMLWGIDAGKDILNIKGLSEEGQATAQSTIQKTAEFGQSVIQNAANNFKQAVTEVNKAASKLEAQKGETPTANEEIKKEIKSTVEKVEKQLPQTNDVADKVKYDNKPPETLADKKLEEIGVTESKPETKAGADVKTNMTTETPKTETETITTAQDKKIEDKVDITKNLAKETVETNIFASKTADIPDFTDTATTIATEPVIEPTTVETSV